MNIQQDNRNNNHLLCLHTLDHSPIDFLHIHPHLGKKQSNRISIILATNDHDIKNVKGYSSCQPFQIKRLSYMTYKRHIMTRKKVG